jgi:hypothetical protein
MKDMLVPFLKKFILCCFLPCFTFLKGAEALLKQKKASLALAAAAGPFFFDTQTGLFVCGTCNTTRDKRSNMRSHITVHSEERAFTCDYVDNEGVHCGAKCKRIDTLKRHKREMHAPLRFSLCPRCSQTFKRERTLLFHLANDHPKRCAKSKNKKASKKPRKLPKKNLLETVAALSSSNTVSGKNAEEAMDNPTPSPTSQEELFSLPLPPASALSFADVERMMLE